MSIPTHRIDEADMVEDEVSAAISGIKGGNQVSTGINTPKTGGVHRKEVYEHIKGERGVSNRDRRN